MAGLLNTPPFSGGLLGNPMQGGLLGGRPTFASMYPEVVAGQTLPAYRPSEEQRAAMLREVLTDLAPVQIIKGMAGGVADLAMQANEAMPWGGANPSAVGLYPNAQAPEHYPPSVAGGMDPSVMIPFAADVAGMATTGALAAPPVSGAAGMGIRAYHGSPHDFDRFSMDKIGTGEGAQAYGHGLYFAENEGVANSYKKSLGGSRAEITDPTTGQRRTLDYDEWHDTLPDILAQVDPKMARYSTRPITDAVADAAIYGGTPLEAFDRAAANRLQAMVERGDPENWINLEKARAAQYRAAIERISPDNINVGKMYEVDINASPDEFLDWDKPLSEQPAKVRDAIKALPDNAAKLFAEGQMDSKAGEHFLRYLQVDRGGAPNAASEALRAAGIKGIRYRDAGSRSPDASGGTSNFVVFDDNIIDILRKYGIAGLTAGGAGAAMLGGTQDASAMPMPSYTTGGRF